MRPAHFYISTLHLPQPLWRFWYNVLSPRPYGCSSNFCMPFLYLFSSNYFYILLIIGMFSEWFHSFFFKYWWLLHEQPQPVSSSHKAPYWTAYSKYILSPALFEKTGNELVSALYSWCLIRLVCFLVYPIIYFVNFCSVCTLQQILQKVLEKNKVIK